MVHQEYPLLMWFLHKDYESTPEDTILIEITISFHIICEMFDHNTFITSVSMKFAIHRISGSGVYIELKISYWLADNVLI